MYLNVQDLKPPYMRVYFNTVLEYSSYCTFSTSNVWFLAQLIDSFPEVLSHRIELPGQTCHFTFSFFLSHLVPHGWCNKDHGVYYPVCRMMHIEDPFLEKCHPQSGISRFLSHYLYGP